MSSLFLSLGSWIVESVEEPLASGDEASWLDEREYPPFYIIAARKRQYMHRL